MGFKVGDTAEYTQTLTEAQVALFVGATGDHNPLHLDEVYARKTRFKGRIVHGLLTAGLISTAIGTKLPGTGAVYLGQTLRFHRPVYLGDTVTARLEVTGVKERPGGQILTLRTLCLNHKGEVVIEGEATVLYEVAGKEEA